MKKLIIAAATACTLAITAQAQDKATLDLLVKKGLITQEESDNLIKAKAASPATTTSKDSAVKGITIGAVAQARYQYISVDNHGGPDPADSNGFMARRVILNFGANFGEGFSCAIAPEFDMTRSGAQQAGLNLAVLRHTSEYGVADLGFRKVNFGLEEYVSGPATENLCPEYSVATWRLASYGFASRHVGAFWDGKIKDTGIFYGAALTNSQQDLWNPGGIITPAVPAANPGATPGGAPGGAQVAAGNNLNANNSNNNELAYWANVGYTFGDEKEVKTTLGLNTGFLGDTGNGIGSVFGYNPFVRMNAGPATLIAEFLGWHANGNNGFADANSYGVNVTGAYKVTETIEPVLRFSRFDGDGLRAPVPALVQGASPTSTIYDRATSLYAGINWYVRKNYIKVQTGYEYTKLTRPLAGSADGADAHALRAQVQLAF